MNRGKQILPPDNLTLQVFQWSRSTAPPPRISIMPPPRKSIIPPPQPTYPPGALQILPGTKRLN